MLHIKEHKNMMKITKTGNKIMSEAENAALRSGCYNLLGIAWSFEAQCWMSTETAGYADSLCWTIEDCGSEYCYYQTALWQVCRHIENIGVSVITDDYNGTFSKILRELGYYLVPCVDNDDDEPIEWVEVFDSQEAADEFLRNCNTSIVAGHGGRIFEDNDFTDDEISFEDDSVNEEPSSFEWESSPETGELCYYGSMVEAFWDEYEEEGSIFLGVPSKKYGGFKVKHHAIVKNKSKLEEIINGIIDDPDDYTIDDGVIYRYSYNIAFDKDGRHHTGREYLDENCQWQYEYEEPVD